MEDAYDVEDVEYVPGELDVPDVEDSPDVPNVEDEKYIQDVDHVKNSNVEDKVENADNEVHVKYNVIVDSENVREDVHLSDIIMEEDYEIIKSQIVTAELPDASYLSGSQKENGIQTLDHGSREQLELAEGDKLLIPDDISKVVDKNEVVYHDQSIDSLINSMTKFDTAGIKNRKMRADHGRTFHRPTIIESISVRKPSNNPKLYFSSKSRQTLDAQIGNKQYINSRKINIIQAPIHNSPSFEVKYTTVDNNIHNPRVAETKHSSTRPKSIGMYKLPIDLEPINFKTLQKEYNMHTSINTIPAVPSLKRPTLDIWLHNSTELTSLMLPVKYVSNTIVDDIMRMHNKNTVNIFPANPIKFTKIQIEDFESHKPYKETVDLSWQELHRNKILDGYTIKSTLQSYKAIVNLSWLNPMFSVISVSSLKEFQQSYKGTVDLSSLNKKYNIPNSINSKRGETYKTVLDLVWLNLEVDNLSKINTAGTYFKTTYQNFMELNAINSSEYQRLESILQPFPSSYKDSLNITWLDKHIVNTVNTLNQQYNKYKKPVDITWLNIQTAKTTECILVHKLAYKECDLVFINPVVYVKHALLTDAMCNINKATPDLIVLNKHAHQLGSYQEIPLTTISFYSCYKCSIYNDVSRKYSNIEMPYVSFIKYRALGLTSINRLKRCGAVNLFKLTVTNRDPVDIYCVNKMKGAIRKPIANKIIEKAQTRQVKRYSICLEPVNKHFKRNKNSNCCSTAINSKSHTSSKKTSVLSPDEVNNVEQLQIRFIKSKRKLMWKEYVETIQKCLGMDNMNSPDGLTQNEIHSINHIKSKSRKIWIHTVKSVKELKQKLRNMIKRTVRNGMDQEGSLQEDEIKVLTKLKKQSTTIWKSRYQDGINYLSDLIKDVDKSRVLLTTMLTDGTESSHLILKAFLLLLVAINISILLFWQIIKRIFF